MCTARATDVRVSGTAGVKAHGTVCYRASRSSTVRRSVQQRCTKSGQRAVKNTRAGFARLLVRRRSHDSATTDQPNRLFVQRTDCCALRGQRTNAIAGWHRPHRIIGAAVRTSRHTCAWRRSRRARRRSPDDADRRGTATSDRRRPSRRSAHGNRPGAWPSTAAFRPARH